MRKNCKETLEAWKASKRKRSSDSIWTENGIVYSYRTAILERRYDSIVHKWIFYLNMTKYSVTTTIHQNAIYAYLLRNHPKDIIVKFDDLYRGVQDLRKYYPCEDYNYTIITQEAA